MGTPARFVALLFASVQLAMPAASAVADGRAASDGSTLVGHVEARTSESCPVVHSPDCGVCRYLSGHGSDVGQALPIVPRRARDLAIPGVAYSQSRSTVALPLGRAPPLNV